MRILMMMNTAYERCIGKGVLQHWEIHGPKTFAVTRQTISSKRYPAHLSDPRRFHALVQPSGLIDMTN
jgi:hypothetical protein